MDVRYHLDHESGIPHIYDHGVSEEEVEDVLLGDADDYPGREGSRIRLGRTANGRYLKVIYSPDDNGDGVFVITAYEMSERLKKAFRRRRRGK